MINIHYLAYYNSMIKSVKPLWDLIYCEDKYALSPQKCGDNLIISPQNINFVI